MKQTSTTGLPASRGSLLAAVLSLLLAVGLAGCGDAPSGVDPHAGRMVYIDTVSREPVVANILRETPAVHPATGERTLIPALYCDACRAWQPAPPLEVAQRTPASRRCPQCRGPLNSTGPWPE